MTSTTTEPVLAGLLASATRYLFLTGNAGIEPVPVPDVPGLHAVSIDPSAAAAHYRENVVCPYRDTLPASAILPWTAALPTGAGWARRARRHRPSPGAAPDRSLVRAGGR